MVRANEPYPKQLSTAVVQSMIETELEMECLVIFLIQYTTSVRGQQENGPAERNREGGREIERVRGAESERVTGREVPSRKSV